MLFYRFYTFILFFLRPLISLYIFIRLLKGKEDRARLKERFGHASVKRPYGELFWFHGASVGETQSAICLIEKLHKANPKLKFLMTSGTTSSASFLKKRLPDYVIHQYVPIDIPSAVRRFLHHWRPAICFRIDSEIWPVSLYEIKKMGIKHFLLNARISDRSFEKYMRKKRTSKFLFSSFDGAFTKGDEEVEKLKALGVPDVYSYGNLKFSNAVPGHDPKELESLKNIIGKRPLWLAASTREGEEDLALNVHRDLKKKIKGLFTIILPRHPKRAEEIIDLAEKKGLNIAVRSKGDTIEKDTDIYLADTMGEMGLFYRLANVVFLGRTIAPYGGSNPIEPAQLHCSIIIGQSTFNFKDLFKEMKDSGSLIQIKHPSHLQGTVERLLIDPLMSTTLSSKAFKHAENQKKVVDKIIRRLRQDELI